MNRKQKKILFRVLLSVVLFLAVWLIDHFALLQQRSLLLLILYSIPYILIGYDVLYHAFSGLLHGELLDEQFLMALATFGAFALREYPEAVAILLFYQIGEWFQSVAVEKSQKNIQALLSLSPERVTLLRENAEIPVAPEEAEAGETMLVRPGERIALDGVILHGASTLDTSALTGESLPEDVEAGDTVYAGCMNLTGALTVKITKKATESAHAGMIRAMQEASAKKSKSERFITRFAYFYTPCVVIAALIVAFIPPIFLGHGLSEWVHRALSLIVISCPCALVVSIPLVFFCGMGKASTLGIYIKGAEFFERLAALRQVAFDKTGTLTKGRFQITGIHPIGITQETLLALAAAAESQSNHPIARSICAACADQTNLPVVRSMTQLSGLGVRAEIEGKIIYVGNADLMRRINISVNNPDHACSVYVAEGATLLGDIMLEDTIKPTAQKAVKALREVGINRTLLLTGDRCEIGEAVATTLGIDKAYCELLPEDKVKIVEENLSDRSPLAFVGDGINDAPVLSRADVGIAMGALGSEIATSAADVVLMDDDPEKLARAIRLSKKANRIAIQNIILALFTKVAVLIPALFGFMPPWLAIFADVGILILCVFNAIRMLK